MLLLTIPSSYIAISAGLAGLSWLLFAWSQRGRSHSKVLAWLSLPFFTLCFVYIWFYLHDARGDLAFDIRTMHARFGLMSIAISQAIILIVLSIINGGTHGRKQ